MIPALPHLKRISHYDVIKSIVRVGTIRVYRAKDITSKLTVTLKVVTRDSPDENTPTILEQFREQAKVSIGLKHHGIIEIYEYGEDGPVAFLASEFLEGCRLTPLQRVPVTDAVSLALQILEALEYAHSRGVIHLGLQPSSLVLTSKGQLKIADFRMSSKKNIVSAYLAPEQLDNSPMDRRVDLFAAGVLFYELLTGKSPFPDPRARDWRIFRETELHPSALNSAVPTVFDAICLKALSKQPNDRYSSAQAFSNDIRNASQRIFASPPSNVVSNETVVSIFLTSLRGGIRQKRMRHANQEFSPPPGSSSLAEAWDESILREVTHQLSAFLGPRSKSIVQDVSAKAKDLDQLYALAGESLENVDDRRAFLASKSNFREKDTKGSNASNNSASTSSRQSEYVPSKNSSRVENDVFLSVQRQFDRLPEEGSRQSIALGNELIHQQQEEIASAPKAKGVARPTEPEHDSQSTLQTSIHSRLEEILGKQPENLAGYLQEKAPEMNEVIHAFVAAADALVKRYAEKNQSVGLTPENICFDRLGKATIRVSTSTVLAGSTMDGALGSPRYAAPEIFAEKTNGTELSPVRSDIYALGFMFYEILLGDELFRAAFAGQRSALEWLRWHADVESKAPPLKQLLPQHPVALSDLIEAMITKDVATRISDPALVYSRLRNIAQQSDKTIIVQKPTGHEQEAVVLPSGHYKSKRRGLKIVLFIVVVAVCVLFAWQNQMLRRKLVPLYLRYLSPHLTGEVAQPNSES